MHQLGRFGRIHASMPWQSRHSNPSRSCVSGLSIMLLALLSCSAQKGMQVPPGQAAVLSPAAAGKNSEPSAQAKQASGARLRPDGAACFTGSHCLSSVCEGANCDGSRPGTCVPENRACTADSVEYCGCDGKTFLSSSSCPGESFSERGRCAEEEAGEPSFNTSSP